MKKHILAISLIVLSACNEKSKLFRYELKVVNETDSTQNLSIFTDFNDDYNFFDDNLKDSIIFHNSSLSKVEGDFMFGLINNKNKFNKILFFSSESASFPKGKMDYRQVVMKGEFDELIPKESPVSINCYNDFYDTTDIILTRQISFLLTGLNEQDTVGYQENVYLKTDEKLITSVLLYTNSKFKEELKLVAKELKSQ